jgi:hypothetical protein
MLLIWVEAGEDSLLSTQQLEVSEAGPPSAKPIASASRLGSTPSPNRTLRYGSTGLRMASPSSSLPSWCGVCSPLYEDWQAPARQSLPEGACGNLRAGPPV